MADISPGLDLARQLDQRFAQAAERRESARQVVEATTSKQADAALAAQQAQEARAARASDDVRRLDLEQRQRSQQQAQALQRFERQRQDTANAPRPANEAQANEAPPRGSIVDILA